MRSGVPSPGKWGATSANFHDHSAMGLTGQSTYLAGVVSSGHFQHQVAIDLARPLQLFQGDRFIDGMRILLASRP